MQILCFGDSITWGSFDQEKGGWVSRLRSYFDSQYEGEYSLYNLGVSGDKVSDLLLRFKSETKARQKNEPLVVIIGIGINDSPHENHPNGTPLERFREDYEALMDKALAASKKLLIVLPTNVDDNHPSNHSYKNSQIKKYLSPIEDIAKNKNVPVVNIFGLITKDQLRVDGLHPNGAGHQSIADRILPELLSVLGLDEVKKNDKLSEAKLYTDGGSRDNPGPSAGAFLICKMDDNVVEKSGFYIGITTNNQAEYQALLKGLQRSQALGVRKLNVFMDSELVVKQLNGLYKIKNKELVPLYHQIKEIAANFEAISFNYVPRIMNKEADGEVNRILDEHPGAK